MVPGRQTEDAVQTHIVYQHTGLLVCRSPHPTSHLLQVFRQGKRGTCQLHELHIGTVETFGEDIHIDQHFNLSPSEIIHQFLAFRSRSPAVDSNRLQPVCAITSRYPAGMGDAGSIYDSFLSVGISFHALIQPADTCLPVQYLVHLLYLVVPVRTPFLQRVYQPLFPAVRTDGHIVKG